MRLTARAIIKNRNTNKILMINYLDLSSKSTDYLLDGFWALPGGGVKKGESFCTALKREIFEETGMEEVLVKDCVLSRNIYLQISEKQPNNYYERYYMVETISENVSMEHLTANETKTIKEYRWWSLEELKITQEIIFPKALPYLMDSFAKNSDKFPIDITDENEIVKYLT